MCGSSTCSDSPAATAASNALPPRSSTAIPAADASQCVEATIPKVPRSSGLVVKVMRAALLCPRRRDEDDAKAVGILHGDPVLLPVRVGRTHRRDAWSLECLLDCCRASQVE